MNFSNVGDLAQSLMMRRHSANLSDQIGTLTRELVTGRTADLGNAVRGDFSVPASLQRSLTRDDAFTGVRKEISGRLSAQQSALNGVSQNIEGLGLRLISDLNDGNGANVKRTLADARVGFDAMVSTLNTQFAGQSIFAGDAPDRGAVASPEQILASVSAAIAGLTTTADIEAAIDDWFFAPGGGFEVDGFTGAPAALTRTSIDETSTLGPTAAADASEIRAVLRDLAVLSLAQAGALPGDAQASAQITSNTAEKFLDSFTGLVTLRADIGADQAQVERADVRAGAQRFASQQAMNELTAIDPYKAATELEAARNSLETLYILTSRTSQLSLTGYLR